MEQNETRERLMPKPRPGYDKLPEGMWADILEYNKAYKDFLDEGKTERECAAFSAELAKRAGFAEFTPGMKAPPGSKLFRARMGKTVMLAVTGSRPLAEGLRVHASHIDSPRLDLKPSPLYEDSGFALLKTHYYGGILKYQWHAIPLELRGVVYKADGSPVNIRVGAAEDEPVLFISDLLPHFAADRMKKPVTEAFTAELLCAVAGALPHAEQGEGRVKLAVLELLERQYGITEEDFVSAELSLVPAWRARDVGLDGALLGGYGHDDRCCSFAGLRALLDLPGIPEHTAVCYLADKEEIGSEGVTGSQSGFFDAFIADLCEAEGVPPRRCYANSFCLSGDVCAALDPGFTDVADTQNHAKAGNGIGVCKYTGRGGKSGGSDASAETMSRLRGLFNKAGVVWQSAELGKADKGGGGTVAAYFARRDIEVVDAGVPVLAMHAPFEVISKLDNYMAYKAALAVYGS